MAFLRDVIIFLFIIRYNIPCALQDTHWYFPLYSQRSGSPWKHRGGHNAAHARSTRMPLRRLEELFDRVAFALLLYFYTPLAIFGKFYKSDVRTGVLAPVVYILMACQNAATHFISPPYHWSLNISLPSPQREAPYPSKSL